MYLSTFILRACVPLRACVRASLDLWVDGYNRRPQSESGSKPDMRACARGSAYTREIQQRAWQESEKPCLHMCIFGAR